MKRLVYVLALAMMLLILFVFLNGTSPEEAGLLELSHGDLTLGQVQGRVYLKEGIFREELAYFEDLEDFQFSPGGDYFTVRESSRTYLYRTEDRRLLEEFDTLGQVYFTEDSKKLLMVRDDESRSVLLYFLESGYLDLVDQGQGQDRFLEGLGPHGFRLREAGKIRELSLLEESEDRLVALLEKSGNSRDILEIFKDLDRTNLRKKYGQDILGQIFKYLGQEELDSKALAEVMDLDQGLAHGDYRAYIEALANQYLKDREVFIRALGSHEDKLGDLAYNFRDLGVLERAKRTEEEEVNAIILSKDLSREEKDLALKFLRVYEDCKT